MIKICVQHVYIQFFWRWTNVRQKILGNDHTFLFVWCICPIFFWLDFVLLFSTFIDKIFHLLNHVIHKRYRQWNTNEWLSKEMLKEVLIKLLKQLCSHTLDRMLSAGEFVTILAFFDFRWLQWSRFGRSPWAYI